MTPIVTEERVRVRYGETDQMGHAYYGNYFLWFEVARGAWCRDRGFTYKSLEERGIKLPCVEAHARYKAEVKYDDWVTIKVTVAEIKRSSMRFEYLVINETTGALATEGYTWHVVMGEERKAISIPAWMRELLERDPAKFERLI